MDADLPKHIIEAVDTAVDPAAALTAAARRASVVLRSSSLLQRQPQSQPRFLRSQSVQSSTEDLSIGGGSDSEHDNGYTTDVTAPSEGSPSEGSPSDAAQLETAPSELTSGDGLSERVEEFRDQEYPQLKGQVYLDHGGTTLYARSLIEAFSADMIGNLYGNPHSASKPSALAGHRVDEVRDRALRFFNADPAHFDLIFVSNATAAIKMVTDCLRDYAAATNTPVWYGYHRDAHTSLVGPREVFHMNRCFASDEEVDIWINSGGLGGPRARQLGLFAYPGQSNMTGRRLPLSWPGRIRKQVHKAATYTLLDAAALASTAPLDLSDATTAPDFVALSFYKIFGFPNIGALIVRKDAAHVLQQRRYFGGGTVEMVVVANDVWHAKKDTALHDRLEDGTLPFHSIFALDHAMTVHETLYGPDPMKFISAHTAALGRLLFDSLSNLRHQSNGTPVCLIYRDENGVYGDASLQGATIAFNVLRSDGTLVGYQGVEEAADSRGIYVRSGSLCNPGGVATYLNWTAGQMRQAYDAGHRCSKPQQLVLGRATGVVRVSLGAMSTAGDVHALIRFLEEAYVEHAHAAPVVRAAGQQDVVPTGLFVPPRQTTSKGRTLLQKQAPISPPPARPLPSTPKTEAGEQRPRTRSAERTPTPAVPKKVTTVTAAVLLPPLDSATDYRRPEVFASDRPRFDPDDFVKHRKPWEQELRRGQWAPGSASDESSLHVGVTPSVKSRKFGRSMVNLLRKERPAMPASHVEASA